MLEFFKNNYSLYLSIFLLSIGLGFQQSFIAPLGENANIESTLLNFIVNAYYLGFFAGVYLVPKMIDNSGYVRSFAVLGTTFSAIFIGFALFKDPISWLALRLLSGFCFSGLYLITEIWINSSIKNENRGNAISLYLTFMFAGVIIGNFMTRFIDEDGLKLLVLTSFMLSLSFIPVLLMRFEPKVVNKKQKMTIKELYQASPMGSMGVLFVGIAYGLNLMLSVYIAAEFNASPEQISNFLVFGALFSLPFTYIIGKLSDKIDRRFVILSLSVVAFFGAFLMSIQNEMGIFIYVAYIILCFGLQPLYSICIAQTNDWLDKSKRVAAGAKLGLLYGLGSIFGGLLTSVLIYFLNPKVLMNMQIIVLTALIIFTIYRIFARSSNDTKAKFVQLPNRVSFSLNVYKSKKKN